MIGLVGYNFLSDINALDPMPTDASRNLTLRVQNGIFDEVVISKDVSSPANPVIPVGWGSDTVLMATFDGTIMGGNIDEVARNITGVKIKRRAVGEFDWVTLQAIDISNPEQLAFVMTDNLALNNIEYEYAYVPMTQDIENDYIIATVLSQFNGAYVADNDRIYRFYADASYGTNEAVQRLGVFEPYGRKYPVVISNGVIQYQTGSVSGLVLPDNYDPSLPIDKMAITTKRNAMVDFLTNKRPKILKDSNGNQWLIYATGNPQTNYRAGTGMSMLDVAFDWTQVGDATNKQDLYESGLIPTGE